MSRPTASTPRRLLWSRWLVLSLLSLTLPLQGALAATMAIGMTLMAPMSSHGAVMTMPTHCEDMGIADMAGMSATEPGMDHAMAHGMDRGGDHADDGTAASSDHHCGICLQCCIGAAIPVAPLIVAAQHLRDAAPTLGAIGAPEQLPQSLDRPPKPFLA